MPTSNDLVWLITGCSSGLGRALAERVLARGFRAVITARDPSSLGDLAGENAVTQALDVNDAGQIAATVAVARERFGRIDVLVNNAGYGYQSTVEEGEEAEIRAQFDTNVFGLFAVTRAVLPVMRAQRRGTIINITSVAGLIGFPGSGYYAATKHAVEGWSDALRAEVAPLGIGVTCVEPGPFRTDWAGRSLKQTATGIADYAETAGKRLDSTRTGSGTQAGDPVRAADAMIALVESGAASGAASGAPPRHLVLGAIGYEGVSAKLQERLDLVRSLKETSLAADFPA